MPLFFEKTFKFRKNLRKLLLKNNYYQKNESKQLICIVNIR